MRKLPDKSQLFQFFFLDFRSTSCGSHSITKLYEWKKHNIAMWLHCIRFSVFSSVLRRPFSTSTTFRIWQHSKVYTRRVTSTIVSFYFILVKTQEKKLCSSNTFQCEWRHNTHSRTHTIRFVRFHCDGNGRHFRCFSTVRDWNRVVCRSHGRFELEIDFWRWISLKLF